ncbi:MAG: sulfatase [Flavobacteriaceae bacterium]|nr:sulfatase [Flavobacteriaceae bacterium]
MRKIKILGLLFITISFLWSCKNESTDKASFDDSKPNLLYIFTDQHRRQAMGFLNEDPVYTPHIDFLAQNGVYFSKAVANHPLCSPYRAMLFTGQYPLTNGVIANCHSGRTAHGNYLKKEAQTISDVVSQNGYNAGLVGKWHLEGPEPTNPGEPLVWSAWCPFDRRHGFDFWYASKGNDHFNPQYWNTYALEDELQTVNQWSPEHEAEIIMEYLEGDGHAPRDINKPFALFWSINPPHNPFHIVPDRYKEFYKDRTYIDLLQRPNVSFVDNKDITVGDHGVEEKINGAPDYFAAVNGVDEQIGRVIEKLKSLGLYDNTIIVFSSDHGEMLGSHGLMHKNIWFKEAYEIPLIVHWPQKLVPKTEDLLISVPDYMPTLLGLMGLEKAIPKEVEGTDYSQILFGQDMKRPESQLYFGSEPSDPSSGKRGFRDDQHTFAVVKNEDGSKSYYLYNDQQDPYQLENIWGRDQQIDQEVSLKLTEILAKRNDPWLEEN